MSRSGAAAPPCTGDELFAALEDGAARRPDEAALWLVADADGRTVPLARGELWRLARSGAAAYRRRGLAPGARVLLNLPTSEELIAALLGAFYAGLWPASIAPLDLASAAATAEWRNVVERLAPDAVVAREPAPGGLLSLLPGEFRAADAGQAGERARGADLRYVQFSSGSTGAPKALVLAMPGIVFNLTGMMRHIPLLAEDHVVSWLPLYHDMGLFGALLISLCLGNRLTLMDPSLFVRHPMIWFRTIQRAGATITVGPPSAYKAAMELLRRRAPADLDLSSCTRWLCGAELVTPALVQSFREVLVPLGAPAEGLKPVYGMSEITLAATIPPAGRGPLIDRVERAAFDAAGEARPISAPDALGWVAVGRMMDGQAMLLVDGAGRELPERRVGRVLLRSPSLYVAELHQGRVTPRAGDWLDTGDLGYRVGEELYITGRSRDIIIKGGRNYAPERLEELAGLVDGVDRAAAIGVFDEARQTERVVLLAEAHPRHLGSAEQRDRLRLSARSTLLAAGYELDEVLLVARGSLPRTTSGKLQRGECRRRYLAGLLHQKQSTG